jgi:hypothetical protein
MCPPHFQLEINEEVPKNMTPAIAKVIEISPVRNRPAEIFMQIFFIAGRQPHADPSTSLQYR